MFLGFYPVVWSWACALFQLANYKNSLPTKRGQNTFVFNFCHLRFISYHFRLYQPYKTCITMKKILKKLGVLNFIAVKNQYNNSVGKNDFYNMILRRLKYQKAEILADFLVYELQIHFKECAQYQN